MAGRVYAGFILASGARDFLIESDVHGLTYTFGYCEPDRRKKKFLKYFSAG
jgi:hypothetical protein